MEAREEEDYRFGRWHLLRQSRQLLAGDRPVPLGSRAFDLLVALVEAQGAVLSKDALLARIWPGTVVEENNLQVQVSALRKALGEDAATLVQTVPGRGYRFAVPESPQPTPQPAPAPEAAPTPDEGPPLLVVLPFANMTGEPGQDYLADGITEDMTMALSQFRWFSVIARNSAFTYRGRAVDVRDIGRQLGVRYVLEGSVRRAATRLRVAAQLSEAESGRQVWAERIDGEFADIFDMQDRVTEAVAGAVEPSLRQAEIRRARARPTGNLGAYDLYLRALPLYDAVATEANAEAWQLLRRALAIDPEFVAAQGTLALVAVQRYYQGWAELAELEPALQLAWQVMDGSGDTDPHALVRAAHAVTFLARDHERARRGPTGRSASRPTQRWCCTCPAGTGFMSATGKRLRPGSSAPCG